MTPEFPINDPPIIAEYHGLLSQTGTFDPTIIELHNTTKRTITITRTATGIYKITFSEPVQELKTTIIMQNKDTISLLAWGRSSDTEYNIYTSTTSNVSTDGILNNTPIEIKIYKP